MKKPVRRVDWLHLSDVHLSPRKTGWDANRVLKSLRDDFRKMQAAHGFQPDLIFFTGDLAFGELPDSSVADQYREGARFLEGVRHSFDPAIEPSRVFIVPGNHDVNRSRVYRADTHWLDSLKNDDGASTISALLRDKNHEWRRILERLEGYRRFLADHGYGHLLADDPERLIYWQKVKVADFLVGIAGFNTAWSCGREEEAAKLWLGRWQVETLRSNLEDCDFRIALTHHPCNWLRKEEDTVLRRSIEQRFEFHLHGHEHLGWADKLDRHVRIAAGACYEESIKENGYSLASISPADGAGEIRFRRYDNTGGGWVARNISGKAEDDGCWALKLPWLNPELQTELEVFVVEDLPPEDEFLVPISRPPSDRR